MVFNVAFIDHVIRMVGGPLKTILDGVCAQGFLPPWLVAASVVVLGISPD